VARRYLEGRTRTRTLLSHIITHAELNSEQDTWEVWQLIDFFASLLSDSLRPFENLRVAPSKAEGRLAADAARSGRTRVR